jgi:uncharacterized protein YajQ (UPF0234 family)
MPTFDVVSEVDMHEVTNAVDQSNREVRTRFDFKGTDSSFSREGEAITLKSESDFQLKQMLDMLQGKLNKRGIDIACLAIAEPELVGKEARQTVTIRQGLETDLSRKIVKMLKESKLKVQGAIQGDKVRVTGKKRDDLQEVIATLREAKFDMPLQYIAGRGPARPPLSRGSRQSFGRTGGWCCRGTRTTGRCLARGRLGAIEGAGITRRRRFTRHHCVRRRALLRLRYRRCVAGGAGRRLARQRLGSECLQHHDFPGRRGHRAHRAGLAEGSACAAP